MSGFFVSCGTHQNRQLQVSSPDNTIHVIFSLVKGKPQYMVTKNGKTVIEPSTMGFEIRDHTDGHTRYKLLSYDEDSKKETWEQPWGEFRFIEDWHNELTLHLKRKAERKS